MESTFFWLFAVISVLGAVGVVVARSPVRGALWLVSSLFSLAVLFVLLEAHLVAALEVLVYAGAVMVLFIFVIMLLNLREEDLGPRRITLVKVVGVAAAAYLGWLLVPPLARVGVAPGGLPGDFGTVEGVGALLFRAHVLPFELTSLLLLAAVVGAVLLAKRRV
jgi:NADH-quinone oxidoreductase subunit J